MNAGAAVLFLLADPTLQIPVCHCSDAPLTHAGAWMTPSVGPNVNSALSGSSCAHCALEDFDQTFKTLISENISRLKTACQQVTEI